MSSQTRLKIFVIGGGAAGFFSALAAKEQNPTAEVSILERGSKLLSKVRISGGGRCNVTHGCFEPMILSQNYPRGRRELLSPFQRFQPFDTIEWFKARGITLKQEADGRMFPTTDSSETIIQCFLNEAKRLGIEICTETKLRSIRKNAGQFELDLGDHILHADRVILATGSSPLGWALAQSLGHTITPAVPSLFTFNVPSFPLIELAGVSIARAKLQINESPFSQEGPLLITHWGFSGPAALKLSAFAARHLAASKYDISLRIDWLPEVSEEKLRQKIEQERKESPAKAISATQPLALPKSLWKKLCERSGTPHQTPLNGLSKKAVAQLCQTLKADQYDVRGKTTNKEEFVTCGGVALTEVNFKTMESKHCQNLFFCGEILDIDGITGGFNFQNAWTTGWIAGKAASFEQLV